MHFESRTLSASEEFSNQKSTQLRWRLIWIEESFNKITLLLRSGLKFIKKFFVHE